MNRHSRQRFYAELDAYAAFWAETPKSVDLLIVKKPTAVGDCSEERLLSIVDRIKRYTD